MALSFGPATTTPAATAPEVIHDELHFGGYLRPPEVPPDPTGEGWRGPPGADGKDGQDGVDGADSTVPGPPGPASTVPGPPGAPGISMTEGAGPPAGTAPVGTLYIDSVTGDLWQFN